MDFLDYIYSSIHPFIITLAFIVFYVIGTKLVWVRQQMAIIS